MRVFREIRNWLRALFARDDFQREADLEMQHHLDALTNEYISEGMEPKAARKAAQKQFGNFEYLREDCRASWGVQVVDDFVGDFKYAVRQVSKYKIHTAIIVLTLAVCMGSNTAAYNLVVKLISNPYDYEDEDRIVQVGKLWTKYSGDVVNQISVPHFNFLQEQSSSFSEIGFVDDETHYDLDVGGRVRRVSGDAVSPEIWRVTGVQPIRGKIFDQEQVEKTNGRVIVLGERLWKELGGQESELLGENLLLDGQSYKVIGVMPESFYLSMTRVDLWVPRIFQPHEKEGRNRHDHSYLALAKLKPGVSLEQAKQDLRSVYASFLTLYPEDVEEQERSGADFGAVPVKRMIVQDLGQIEMAFRSIQIVTLLVLIIGCLNVGGMILVKGYSRIQELAMRKSMGASTFRLVRQVYVEIFVYFLLGGVCSLLILKGSFAGLKLLKMDEIPWAGEWSVDSSSLAMTVAIALGAGLVTGVMPVVSIMKRNLMDFVKTGNRTMAGSVSKHRLHASFVIAQVSLSVILLIGAGVLVRNLNSVLQKDVGFEREGRVAIAVPQPGYRFEWGEENYVAKTLPYQERMLERIRSIPGVINASASSRVPISVNNMGHSNFSMHHYEFAKGEAHANALRVIVRPNYFETVGTRLLRGRDFEDTDTIESESVVIISQNTMERYYEGLDPVGMSINFWGRDLKIVGVAEQVQDKPFFVDWDGYTLYFPFAQWHNMHNRQTTYIAHVGGDTIDQMKTIERALLELDPLATIQATTFEEDYEVAIFAHELPMIMTAIFASLAMFLSGLGLYGLISFMVVERTKEYGIRMALGAQPLMILKRVLGGSSRLIGFGLVAGIILSFLLCRQINPMLVDINTTHPITFIVVAGFVFGVCMIASFFPAFRATRISINETLQC